VVSIQLIMLCFQGPGLFMMVQFIQIYNDELIEQYVYRLICANINVMLFWSSENAKINKKTLFVGKKRK
jgi:hypothetical protein